MWYRTPAQDHALEVGTVELVMHCLQLHGSQPAACAAACWALGVLNSNEEFEADSASQAGLSSGFRFQGLGFGVWGSGVLGRGFGFWLKGLGSGSGLWFQGFGVYSFCWKGGKERSGGGEMRRTRRPLRIAQATC